MTKQYGHASQDAYDARTKPIDVVIPDSMASVGADAVSEDPELQEGSRMERRRPGQDRRARGNWDEPRPDAALAPNYELAETIHRATDNAGLKCDGDHSKGWGTCQLIAQRMPEAAQRDTSTCWFCHREVPTDTLIAGYDTFDEQRLACPTCDTALREAGTPPEPDHALHFDPGCEECVYLARPVVIRVPAGTPPEPKMSTTTEAGKRLLMWLDFGLPLGHDFGKAVAAIEAEAVKADRARIAESREPEQIA